MAGEDSIYRMLQNIVMEHISQIGLPQIGIVESVDSKNYTVRARLVYDNVLTGPLRVSEPSVGNGWGITNMPIIGQEVMVCFQSGHLNDGYVIGRFYGDDVPATFNLNDYQIKHKSGSSVVLSDNGNVSHTSSGGAVLSVDKDGNAILKNGGGDTSLKVNNDKTVKADNGKGSIEIASDGLITIKNQTTTLKLTSSGKIVLSNSTAELLDLVNQLLTQLTTPLNVQVAVPAGIGSFSAPVLAQLQLIKSFIGTLKQ